jgi:hypothetical protein
MWMDAMGLEFIHMTISGTTPVEDTSWGSIKAMYR